MAIHRTCTLLLLLVVVVNAMLVIGHIVVTVEIATLRVLLVLQSRRWHTQLLKLQMLLW